MSMYSYAVEEDLFFLNSEYTLNESADLTVIQEASMQPLINAFNKVKEKYKDVKEADKLLGQIEVALMDAKSYNLYDRNIGRNIIRHISAMLTSLSTAFAIVSTSSDIATSIMSHKSIVNITLKVCKALATYCIIGVGSSAVRGAVDVSSVNSILDQYDRYIKNCDDEDLKKKLQSDRNYLQAKYDKLKAKFKKKK